MAFPVFLDLEKKKCLIVGGGPVAFRKAKTLWQFCPQLSIVAPKFCTELLDCLELQGALVSRVYQETDLDGMAFVIAATDDKELNQQIVLACNQRRILVNAATICEEGDTVAFPSIIRQGLVTIGIHSGGNPALSKMLRQRITVVLPKDLAEKSKQSKEFRELQKQTKTGAALKAVMTEEMKQWEEGLGGSK